MSADRADQGFLHHGGDQLALACEEVPTRESSRAESGRAVLMVEEPAVGPERPVEPDGMIQAGNHERSQFPVSAMGLQDAVDEGKIGGIGQDALMQEGVIG